MTRPSQLSTAKPFPEFGDTLCDVLALKEEALSKEQQAMTDVNNKVAMSM